MTKTNSFSHFLCKTFFSWRIVDILYNLSFNCKHSDLIFLCYTTYKAIVILLTIYLVLYTTSCDLLYNWKFVLLTYNWWVSFFFFKENRKYEWVIYNSVITALSHHPVCVCSYVYAWGHLFQWHTFLPFIYSEQLF